MTNSPREHDCIPAAELPGSTALYAAFLNDFPRVSEFYAHSPDPNGIQNSSRELYYDNAMRQAIVDILRQQNREFGGDEHTFRNLDRLRDGAAAVVTGQQVGLLGGPAYSVYKALTAVHVAHGLTEQGTNAVPIFWLATEDHDLAEVDHSFLAKRGGAERFELHSSGVSDRRVGEIKLGEAVRELAMQAAGLLDGISAEEAARILTESYRPEETFGSAFARLMTRIFAGRGLIFLDPLSPELHRLSAATMIRAVQEHEAITEDLLTRSSALEQAGYHAQVKVTEKNTLVFRIVDGQRLALRPSNGGFTAGTKQESAEETFQAMEKSPEDFSPSALLRPVVQDTLLPTIAFVAGPAEVAYQAQTSLLYKRLLGRAPAILPRASFTLVTAHVFNLLKKYNLDIREVFAGRHRLRAKLEAEALPQTLSARFEEGERAIKALLENLREPLGRLDQTLVGALDTASEKVLYQFNGLRAKAGRAESFRSGVVNTHENEIAGLLLPNNELQERSLAFISFFALEGKELLDRLDQSIRPGSGEHCVIYL